MPLPDESRPGRASELIRRFQAAVDTAGEKPLTVSSSFAAPAAPPRHRVSGPQKEEGKGNVKEVVEAGEDKSLFFRSAGLKGKPAVPVEQQGRKNAKEAFPDTQKAPKVEDVAREMEEGASKQEEEPSPSAEADEPAPEPSQTTQDTPAHPASPPHPVITQPSLDVPPPVPVPGSTDLLSSPASPAPAEEHKEQEVSLKAREGLSRPTSPAALRVPPTTDDSSPPPTPAPAPAPSSNSTPSRPHRATRTSPTTSRAFPTSSPSPSSTPRRTSTSPSTSRLTAPTASSLAKSVSRSAGAASSGSPGQSPSRSRKSVPSPAASPRLGTGSSAAMTRQSSGGGASSAMRESLSASSTSSSAAAKTSSGMTRSTSSSTSSSSTAAASPCASPRLGSPAAGRNGTPLRMARTGRVGLAGAHATRPPPRSSPAPASSSPKPAAEGQNASGKAKEDDIPVFPGPAGGFLGPGTSRPIGKIGIPVVRNQETGDVEAVGRGEVESAGEEARRRMEGKEGE